MSISTASNTAPVASASRVAWAAMAAATPPTRQALLRSYLDRAAALPMGAKIELDFETYDAAQHFRWSLNNHRRNHPRAAEIQISTRVPSEAGGRAKVILTRLPLPIGETIIGIGEVEA